MIELRDYQVQTVANTRRAVVDLRAQARLRGDDAPGAAVLVVSPTGSGKTTMASDMVRGAIERSRTALWLAHRNELVEQGFDRLTAFGLTAGAIAASNTRPPNPYAQVQVASIQTLIARNLRPKADVIIWDEAHHAPSDLWSGIAKDYAGSTLIGFTATPERSDGRGLGAIYQDLVVAASVQELTTQGFLVPCDIRRPASRLRPNQIAKRPVDAYREEAMGRRAIVFSPSIKAAVVHAEEFAAHGIRAEVVTGDTPHVERQRLFDEVRRGTLRVLVNVYVCTEGLDVPEIDCVILARSCGTMGVCLQMTGRGLRPAPGKSDCLLIDLHGVTHVFGHPADERTYSLEGKGIRAANDVEVDTQGSCRVCGAPIVAGEACAECGTEPKQIKPPSVANVALVKYAAKRRESEGDRAKTLARWMAAARAAGWKPSQPKMKYRAVYGDWPPAAIVERARELLDRGEVAA